MHEPSDSSIVVAADRAGRLYQSELLVADLWISNLRIFAAAKEMLDGRLLAD